MFVHLVVTNALKVFNIQFTKHGELIALLIVLCTIIRKHANMSMGNLLQMQSFILKLTTFKQIVIVKPCTCTYMF